MNYWTELQNSNGLLNIWNICRGEPGVVGPGVTDDVPSQTKLKMFDDLSGLALSRSTTVSDRNAPTNP